MDLTMPIIDGAEATPRIRCVPKHRKFPSSFFQRIAMANEAKKLAPQDAMNVFRNEPPSQRFERYLITTFTNQRCIIRARDMKKHSRLAGCVVIVASVLGAGLWLRNVQALKIADGQTGWRLWPASTTASLYFSDGRFLFPVSRRISKNDDLPRAVLQALWAGPSTASHLENPIPPGLHLRSFRLQGGIAHIDLSAVPNWPAQMAIVETMTAVPGVTSVELSVEGKAAGDPVKRTPLLYFASMKGLMAVPSRAMKPRNALDTYLAGPPAPDLTGLPPDVRLLAYDDNSSSGLLSLKFSYTSTLRALAIDRPDRMRTVLLGLIATLTEFPEVRAVQLDFGGQTRLGLGQCSDLLRTPQPRPILLNDERLL
jgi:spore germination protein GerM